MSRNWLGIEKWTCVIFALGSNRRLVGALIHLAVVTRALSEFCEFYKQHFPHGFDLQKVQKWKLQQELTKSRSLVWMWGSLCVACCFILLSWYFRWSVGKWFLAASTMEKSSTVSQGSSYSTAVAVTGQNDFLSRPHARAHLHLSREFIQ